MTGPDTLAPDEAAIWTETLPRMASRTPQRLLALEAYCVERARWLRAEAQLQRHGDVVALNDGAPVPSPFLRIAQQAQDRAIKLASQLGLRAT